VSLDGFRWDYKKHFDTPNLNIVANKGVKAKSMKPSYPTKTVPESLYYVTFCRSRSLSIFYDPRFREVFSLVILKRMPVLGGNPFGMQCSKVSELLRFTTGSDTGREAQVSLKRMIL
jgi:alkaline phosphatase D